MPHDTVLIATIAAGLGLAFSVASIVVLLRALEERGVLDSVNGRIAVGWLIVEDLAMVLALMLLPALAVPLGGTPTAGADADGSIGLSIAVTLAKVSRSAPSSPASSSASRT